MGIITADTTTSSFSQRDLSYDELDRRRALNFILFNFSRYLLASSGTEESLHAKRLCDLHHEFNSAIQVLKYKSDEIEEFKHLKKSSDAWMEISKDKFLSVYRLIYYSVIEPIRLSKGANYSSPLFHFRNVLLDYKDDGVFSLLGDFECELQGKYYSRNGNDSDCFLALARAINILDMTMVLLKKTSVCVMKLLDNSDESSNVKACAILVKLSSELEKPIGSLVTPTKYCSHGKVPVMGVEAKDILIFNNAVDRLQVVIDSVIIGDGMHLIEHDVKQNLSPEVSGAKGRSVSLISEVLDFNFNNKILRSKVKIKNLAARDDLFLTYLRNNTFKSISNSDFYRLYEQAAKEHGLTFNFFCVMAAAFIPESDLFKVLVSAKSAIDIKTKRKLQPKRAQMNVDVDKGFLKRLNDFCDENKMKQSEVVKLAVSEFINKSSR